MAKLFPLLMFLLLTACENDLAPVYQKMSQQGVVLAFGDSLTYGTGATQGADYPAILSQISSHQVINEGVPGEISSHGLKRLPTLLDQYQPELLVLVHGGNDLLRKIPDQQIASNLKQMISAARKRDIKVVMLGVPKPNLLYLTSPEFYQQVAQQLQVPIDMDTLPDILGSNALKSDTIHPNDEGYKIMAKNIYQLIKASGAL